MRLEQTGAHVAATARPGQRPTSTAPAAGAGWEGRLYDGLRVGRVPSEIRAPLIEALGETGVEAEHWLAVANGFLYSHAASRELGDLFLRQLDAGGRRLAHAADRLEVATQGYLAAMEAEYPGVREAAAQDDVWWPEQAQALPTFEPLELRLRRCGFAYRHVVAAHLPANVEAITDCAIQFLHALGALPPAGIVPAGSLYRGLDELTSALQGYVIPNHIADLSDQTPGLLTGIARLYALDVHEDTSIESDLAWAKAQIALAQSTQVHLDAGRMGSAGQGARWALAAVTEWRQTITSLEGLRATQLKGIAY